MTSQTCKRAIPAATGSATQHVTSVFGKPAGGRLDSKPAAAIFLADEPGSSGIFNYVAVASVTAVIPTLSSLLTASCRGRLCSMAAPSSSPI